MNRKFFLKLISALKGVEAPSLNPSPFEVIFTENKSRLLFFRGDREGSLKKSLFILYALINRYYILDITEKLSVINFLNKRGFDVYVLDWGIAQREDRLFSMHYYIEGIALRAFKKALLHSGEEKMPLLGYCMGGIIAAIFTSLHPQLVSSLVTVAAPIDFKTSSKIANWIDEKYFDADALVKSYGNVPAEIIENGFVFLTPFSLIKKYVMIFAEDNKEKVRDFIAVENWVIDNIPFPGGFYKQYIKDLYQKNLLFLGGMKIGEKDVDLKNISCPVLVVSAKKDPIVYPQSSRALLNLVRSKFKEELEVETGHIGIAVSKTHSQKVWSKIIQFIMEER